MNPLRTIRARPCGRDVVCFAANDPSSLIAPGSSQRRCEQAPIPALHRTRAQSYEPRGGDGELGCAVFFQRVRGAIAHTLLCWALFTLLPGAAHAADEVQVGELLRDATLQGLNGPARRLSQYRGRPLIINVWASWCGPCIEEMASLERLVWQEQLGPFAVIGISTDDYADRAQDFLKRSNATISHFIDRDLLLEHMLGASKIPLTVLVDADGRVRDKIYGARQWDAPESLRLIARAFGPPKASSAR
jgi:thiol-disulfide isomerase/thioredoxin